MLSNRSVCQGLQSYFKPLILEERVLTHEFVPSKPDSSFSSRSHNEIENHKPRPINVEKPREINKKGEKLNIRDVTQAPTNNSPDSTQVYVHPLDKSSTFSLSPKGLEMCTESLGSETGNNSYSSFDEFPYLVPKKQSCSRNKPAKKICKKINFPPPLTSRSGEKGLKIESCREGGRLVIKASAFSSGSGCFKAERENGRLRLCLVKEKDEVDNIDDDEAENEGDYNGRLWGGEWSSSRCNGDESGSKRMPSLPVCVAIS